MIAAFTPGWYLAIIVPVSFYLLALCLLFLVVQPPRRRNVGTIGVGLMALAIAISATRVLWRILLSDLPPLFTSDLDAATAIMPNVLAAVAVTLLMLARRRQRVSEHDLSQ